MSTLKDNVKIFARAADCQDHFGLLHPSAVMREFIPAEVREYIDLMTPRELEILINLLYPSYDPSIAQKPLPEYSAVGGADGITLRPLV